MLAIRRAPAPQLIRVLGRQSEEDMGTESLGKRGALLVGPLVAIFLVAFAMYGTEGPPDNERVNSVARLVGVAYGIYAVGIIAFWVKAGRK